MKLLSLITLLRPAHWIKNLFVLIPLIFSRNFLDPSFILPSLEAMAIFMLASSAGYILNDILDVATDRLHPEKRSRSVPSGKIPLQTAGAFYIVFLAAALFFATMISGAFFIMIISYLLLMMAYSVFLKKILFLDVLVIATGYVLRVIGGGIAAKIPVTEWTIILVFLLVSVLVLGKRRQEIKKLKTTSKKTRAVLTQYTIPLIDQLHAVMIPLTLASYVYFVFSSRPHQLFSLLTIPLVLYFLFRYWYLLRYSHFGETFEDFLKDVPLVAVSIGWLFFVLF